MKKFKVEIGTRRWVMLVGGIYLGGKYIKISQINSLADTVLGAILVGIIIYSLFYIVDKKKLKENIN